MQPKARTQKDVISDEECLHRLKQFVTSAEGDHSEVLAGNALRSAHWVLMLAHMREWYPADPVRTSNNRNTRKITHTDNMHKRHRTSSNKQTTRRAVAVK